MSNLPKNFMDVRKTLDMKLVGRDGQNDPFSKISTSFLQKFCIDICEDLAMEPVGPDGQNILFSRSNVPRSWYTSSFANFSYATVHNIFLVFQNSYVMFSKKLHGRSLDLIYGDGWSTRIKQPIFKVKRAPQYVNPSFYRFFVCYSPKIVVDPEFRHYLFQKISWTSVKTLAMELVVYGIFGDLEFRHHFSKKNSLTSVNTLAMESVVPDGQNGPFSRSNEPPNSSPFLLVYWIPMSILPKNFMDAKTTHFQGQTNPGTEKPSTLSILCAIAHHLFWCSGIPTSFLPKIFIDVHEDLDMEPIGLDGQNVPFSSSLSFLVFRNSDIIFQNLYMDIRLTLLIELVGHHSKTTHFQGQTNPTIWSQLALTDKMAHFQCQTSPGAGETPILSFSYAIVHHLFWCFKILKLFLLKIYMDVR
ncbi:hypothetical protein H5410_031944 [Solanum commersonii]|uniref:Uncharacterized protein n=1 Tax=Solanum commersonii TaxID=4109 RepID=A0A9J5YNW9_SOLCO|nr:hypothetical protein H5410_031944 [Solanum commersonii]